MNSLNKNLIFIAISALALTASTGFILQTDAYVDLKMDFNQLFKENQKNKKQLKEQALTIQQLGDELAIKDDSIMLLNLQITDLVEETNLLKNKIRSLDKRVQQMSDKVVALTKKISTLENSKTSSAKKINDLAFERDELLKQMEILDRERHNNKVSLKQNEENVVQSNESVNRLNVEQDVIKEQLSTIEVPAVKPAINEPIQAATHTLQSDKSDQISAEKKEIIKSRKQARMHQIVMSTQIDYRSIKLKQEKGGKDLDKLKNDGWRYTLIEFDLSNPDQDAIFDEDFILQIFDTDNQQVVPVNESNPSFPDSRMGSTGYRFTYEGQPLKIDYFNSQKKTGKNYEVRLFYAGKGYLLPIKNGNTRIVQNELVAER